jgi:hypothetical protein
MNDQAMSSLLRYESAIMGMHRQGWSTNQIATHLYEHAVGPLDKNYREMDICFIAGLVDRFLQAPRAEQERMIRLQQESEAARHQAEQERRARDAIRKMKLAEQRARAKAEREREEELIRELAESRRRHFEEECAKVPAWRDRNWEEVLPPWLAVKQASWCRHMAALRMKRTGLTYEEVGYRMRVSRERARQLIQKAQRYERSLHGNRSPLERYFAELATVDSRDDEFASDVSHKFARRFLKTVEVLTGLATVPRCSAAERRTWELYYAMRGDHEQESHHHHLGP